MKSIIRHGISAVVAIGALSGAACGGSDQKPLLDPISKETPTPNPGDTFIPATGTATNVPTFKTVADRPMPYWISVPKGWPGNRSWPIVITIQGSTRDFESGAKAFAAERDAKNYPFIIVSPTVTTNTFDGPVPRTTAGYVYTPAAWDLIESEGRCAFDMNGMAALVAEVRNKYAGQSHAFLTGFSGGGHPTWAMMLLKPEVLRGVAPVATNYSGKCITNEVVGTVAVSHAPERVLLPVMTFTGANDTFGPQGLAQQQKAIDLARSNGYTNFGATTVPGIGHDPMVSTVLNYFWAQLNSSER